MAQFDQKADPFHFDDTLVPGDTFEGGGLEWHAHAAPGHDMDALMYFEPTHRILLSGDALWENGMGFVWPEEGENPYMDAALDTLAAIERLDPAVVIPGHGQPFTRVGESVASVRSRLHAFARDPARNARHMAKVMFVFALLDRGRMRVDAVPSYLQDVPCYARISQRFLGQEPAQMAEWMLADLERAGAVAIAGGEVRPLMPA
jgi:glyoxylase-like metal-dependent hydrolase (beta-lactamase superfamily II)